jgi:hypothetical protein
MTNKVPFTPRESYLHLGCLTPFTRREYHQGMDKAATQVICDIGLAIEALGGNKAVAELCSVGASAVSNWRARGAFPPRLFIRLSGGAAKSGVTLSQKLFREISSEEAA